MRKRGTPPLKEPSFLLLNPQKAESLLSHHPFPALNSLCGSSLGYSSKGICETSLCWVQWAAFWITKAYILLWTECNPLSCLDSPSNPQIWTPMSKSILESWIGLWIFNADPADLYYLLKEIWGKRAWYGAAGNRGRVGSTTVHFVLCLGLLQCETLRCTINHAAEGSKLHGTTDTGNKTPFQGCSIMAISVIVTSLLRALGSTDSKMGIAWGHFRKQ